MASTSGSYTMSSHGETLRFSWNIARQDIGGNYTVINWWLDYEKPGTSWVHIYSINCWVNGGRVYNRGSARQYGGRIASGQSTIYHEANGHKWFGANGDASIYASGTNAWGSGSWELPPIPRDAKITNLIGDFTDEDTPWLHFSNPGGFRIRVRLEMSGTVFATRDNVGSPYTWSMTEQDRETIREKLKNAVSGSIRLVVVTIRDGREAGWSYQDRTVRIANAEPTAPSRISCVDTNSAMVAITENNQKFIQGISTPKITIPRAGFSTAKKRASISKYVITLNGVSVEKTVPNTGDITHTFGAINSANDLQASIRAVDSRGNSKTSYVTLDMIPYNNPVVGITGTRKNNFENPTTMKISGSIAPIMVGNRKNWVTTLRFRYREVGGAWGGWQDKKQGLSIQNNSTVVVPTWVVNLDSTKVYECEVELTDRLRTTKTTIVVDAGIPILRIGLDGKIYNNEQVLMTTHIGGIITTVSLNTPQKVHEKYGGTWVLFGAGRVIVGVGSNGTTNYTAAEQTGGSDKVQLTTQEMPRHSHRYVRGYWWQKGGRDGMNWGNNNNVTYTWEHDSSEAGGDRPHENRPSYITAYQWKRVL